MSKEQQTKNTLADLMSKKRQKEKDELKIGDYYSKGEDFTFIYNKLDEEVFFYIMDKYPDAFTEEPKMADLLHAFNNIIYECVVIDKNKSLKDKDVREMLGVKATKDIINLSAKALIENYEERLELGGKILEFSGFSNGNKQVEEIKN